MKNNRSKKDTLQMLSPEHLAAWSDTDYLNQRTKVVHPTERGVEEAKEWVDDTEK